MTGIRTFLMATILCAAWNTSAIPQQNQDKDHWVPTLADVQELENHLTKPDPEHLAKSTRFYYGFYDKGNQVIRGEILAEWIHGDKKIHIEPAFPRVFDGGCGIINLSYDPVKHMVLSLRCNGIA